MPPVGVKNDILNLVLKPLTQDVGLDEALEAYEKLVIDAALARHATVNGAVQALGVSRSSLAAKRQKYNSQPV
ncbi:MAG: hypothetical protein EOP04_03310 [Proteobacteria bacterium]|nr:MAG: hypothetical protein EOP04_03310 [Pseudomonadota bacterium]